MSSQSQYFGFDDDATASTSSIQKPSPVQLKIAPKKATPETEQLSISQIQALLCQDLTSLDGSTNLSTTETSFYTDELEAPTAETLTETVTEEFSEDETSTFIEEVESRPRKVLGNIENKTKVKSCKTYKKPANAKVASASFIAKKEVSKEEKPVKVAKKRKTKKETENDENFDKFAELINKQFAQVENFQLHVE